MSLKDTMFSVFIIVISLFSLFFCGKIIPRKSHCLHNSYFKMNVTDKNFEQFLQFLDQYDEKIQFVKGYLESYKTFVSSFIKEKYAYYSQTQNNNYDHEIYDKNLRTPCMNILKVLLRSHNNLFREIDYLTKGVIFTAYQKNETKEEVTTKICERWCHKLGRLRKCISAINNTFT
jgi:hypothetical protein